MRPVFIQGNVRARCPDCNGAISTFECKKDSSHEYGSVLIEEPHLFKENSYDRVVFRLLRCAGCGRGGVAKIHCGNNVNAGELESFYPISIEKVDIPKEVPKEIVSEFREAELCASFGLLRASSALFRSTLEKALKDNGYKEGNLKSKIDKAADDGVITESRRKRVHEDIRVLGNDVLHDEWREIKEDEVEASHHYAQRLLEDFYDDRESVEKILVEKGRITV